MDITSLRHFLKWGSGLIQNNLCLNFLLWEVIGKEKKKEGLGEEGRGKEGMKGNNRNYKLVNFPEFFSNIQSNPYILDIEPTLGKTVKCG